MTKNEWIIFDIECRSSIIEFDLKFDIVRSAYEMERNERGFLRPIHIKFDDDIWAKCEALGLSRSTMQALSRRYEVA